MIQAPAKHRLGAIKDCIPHELGFLEIQYRKGQISYVFKRSFLDSYRNHQSDVPIKSGVC